MLHRKSIKRIHESRYAGEVEIDLHSSDDNWSPTMDDTRTLETVRLALRRGDIAEAAKHERVFKLSPVAAM